MRRGQMIRTGAVLLFLSILPFSRCSLFLSEQMREPCTAGLFKEDGKRGILFSHPMNRESVETAAQLSIAVAYAQNEVIESREIPLDFTWEDDRRYILQGEVLPVFTYTLHLTGVAESRDGRDYSGPRLFILEEGLSSPPWLSIRSVEHLSGEQRETCMDFPLLTPDVDRNSRFIITFAEPLDRYARSIFEQGTVIDPAGMMTSLWEEGGKRCTLSFAAPPPWEYRGSFSLPDQEYPFLFLCNGPREVPLSWQEVTIDGRVMKSGSFIETLEETERSIALSFRHSPLASLAKEDLLEAIHFTLQGGAGHMAIASTELFNNHAGESRIVYRGSFSNCDPGLLLRIEVDPVLEESLGKKLSGNHQLTINLGE